jgi:predicted O-linked N-acetylglucosamine transferase (SPINDLY family)
LASHLAELQKIKAKLSVNQLAEPLFDPTGFVGHLGAAHQKMWPIFTAGQPPQQFEVIEN